MELTFEERIMRYLLLRASIEYDVGLYHGKTGLILFFAHYFRHTGLIVYDDTCDELMDELKEDIHTEMTIGFASGLSGVGWGIEYLIQNGFVEGDSWEVCQEIDQKLMERDPRRITDYTLDNGLEGILHYVLAHIKGTMAQHAKLPFDETYLSDLNQALSVLPKDEMSDSLKSLSSAYTSFFANRGEMDYSFQLGSIPDADELKEIAVTDKKDKNYLNSAPLGLKNGLSGYLFQQLKLERP